LGANLIADIDPDRKTWPHLPYPPFTVTLLAKSLEAWADLRIEGYLDGKLAITKIMPGNDLDRVLQVTPDDQELLGDGIDATRVVLELTNEHGGPRPFSSAAITLQIEGPGEIIGENPLALSGGAGAVWVRSKQGAGAIRLHATHPRLGTKTVEIAVKAAAPEFV
jgi:beta-galactosidase